MVIISYFPFFLVCFLCEGPVRAETEQLISNTIVYLEFDIAHNVRIFCLWILFVHQIFIGTLTRPPITFVGQHLLWHALSYNKINSVYFQFIGVHLVTRARKKCCAYYSTDAMLPLVNHLFFNPLQEKQLRAWEMSGLEPLANLISLLWLMKPILKSH